MDNIQTRKSNRNKQLSTYFRNIDLDQRQYEQQKKIDALESDYYDSPGRMAEDSEDDEYKDDDNQNRKNRKIKKNKLENYVKKNLNL